MTAWHKEVVDSVGNVGHSASLALDANSLPNIAYCDYTNFRLKFAKKNLDNSWTIEIVDTGVNLLLYSALALDSSDFPHISYYDFIDFNLGDLKYAYKDALGWHLTTLDNVGDVGEEPSIVLDSNDFPHISYHDATNGALKYAYQDALGWHFEVVDDGAGDDVGEKTSIALDSNEFPHITYLNDTTNDLEYAYKDALGWHYEIIDASSFYSSLILDGSDYPHVSYQDAASGDINYAYKDALGWHIEIVADVGVAGIVTPTTAIDFDSNGFPRIAYTEIRVGRYTLDHAYKNAGGWNVETVDDVVTVYRCGGFALDAEDLAHISYTDATNGDLKYALGRPGAQTFYILA